MRESRKLQLIILMVLVCLVGTLSIAYAILSTTLQINGHAEVTAASWNIHFDNIQINSGSVEATKSPIVVNSRTIDFVVGLKEPGDYYKFTVDIVNNGTIDAMIDSVVKTPNLTEQQAKYLKYEIEYTDGNSILDKQLLLKDTSKTMSVLVAYRSDVASSDIPTTGESLNLSFTMNYVQADETGNEIPESIPLVRVVSGDLETVGSEICIKNECFYLISSDDKTVTMLAKYNLLVGNKYDGTNGVVPLENQTGLQEQSAIGWKTGSSVHNGVVPFSASSYWESSVSNYPTNVYNSNSIIYSYVENYKLKLKEMGIMINNARLIKEKEILKLGCSNTTYTCSQSQYKWIYSTSYWVDIVGSSTTVSVINTSAFFGGDYYYTNYAYGIRPVVEMSKINF